MLVSIDAIFGMIEFSDKYYLNGYDCFVENQFPFSTIYLCFSPLVSKWFVTLPCVLSPMSCSISSSLSIPCVNAPLTIVSTCVNAS